MTSSSQLHILITVFNSRSSTDKCSYYFCQQHWGKTSWVKQLLSVQRFVHQNRNFRLNQITLNSNYLPHCIKQMFFHQPETLIEVLFTEKLIKYPPVFLYETDTTNQIPHINSWFSYYRAFPIILQLFTEEEKMLNYILVI